MIISRLTGGLGNQMFQYAAGMALAEKHGTALKLDIGWFGTNPTQAPTMRYALHCLNVLEQFATQEEIDRLVGQRGGFCESLVRKGASLLRMHGLSKVLQPVVGHLHNQETFKFYPGFCDQPDNTYLSGVFQSEGFFAPVADQLRLQFTFRYPPPPEVAELASEIRGTEAVSVHFRRGDYASSAKYHKELGLLQMSYYHDALSLLRKKLGFFKMFIFSDDIETIERKFVPDAPRTYVKCVRSGNSYDELRLMALCRYNIIANSTFSWWAAWLNANPSKIVIAPDPFFHGFGLAGPDIVPRSWIKLPATPEAEPADAPLYRLRGDSVS
jgi:hypothetical protein